MTLGEYEQSALGIVVILKTPSKKGVKSFDDIFSGTFDRIFAIDLSILLYNSSEKNDARSRRLFDGESNIEQHLIAF